MSGATETRRTAAAGTAAGATPASSVPKPHTAMTRDQVSTSVAAAAVGLMQAGVTDGEMKINPVDAMKAAAAVYQIAYGAESMRWLMNEAAKSIGMADAFKDLPAGPASR